LSITGQDVDKDGSLNRFVSEVVFQIIEFNLIGTLSYSDILIWIHAGHFHTSSLFWVQY